MDDAELVQSAKRGDRTSFEELIRRTQRSVRFFIAVRSPDPSDVDDVAQEVYVTAFRRLDSFQPSDPFAAWLRGIAMNLIRNRRRRHRPQLLADVTTLLDPPEAVPEPDSDPIEALQECVKGVEERAARILRAKYVDRLSLAEIAGAEGGNAKAISVTLVRIRKRLRACIEDRLRSSARFGGQLS